MPRVWKEKYEIRWCHMCGVALIECEKCEGTTCNSGSCEECQQDFEEFAQNKITVEEYLTPEEQKIYRKGLRIQLLILETLGQGFSQINWKQLQEDGQLSKNDEVMFAKELKDQK